MKFSADNPFDLTRYDGGVREIRQFVDLQTEVVIVAAGDNATAGRVRARHVPRPCSVHDGFCAAVPSATLSCRRLVPLVATPLSHRRGCDTVWASDNGRPFVSFHRHTCVETRSRFMTLRHSRSPRLQNVPLLIRREVKFRRHVVQ